MTLQELEVRILIHDQLVRNAKDAVARRERDWVHAGEQLRHANDKLHDEQCQLQYLRDAFAARAA